MPNMNTLHVLKVARAILEYDDAWTQGALARDEASNEIELKSRGAVCFCAIGAIHRAADITKSGKYDPFVALRTVMDGDIAFWNDAAETTQLHILMAYDFAILMVEDELENA